MEVTNWEQNAKADRSNRIPCIPTPADADCDGPCCRSDRWRGLRDDQRAAQANVAVIVSSAPPKGLDTFDLIDSVWVVRPRFVIPVAIALRQSLVEIAGARLIQEGQQTKTELVYAYLTGPRFRHRVEAIVERFTEMQTDLERERRAMTRMWAKREEQLRAVLDATVGLYGDLQGIAGRVMQEIEGLDVLAITSASEPPKT
ncbi:hypothetical protein BST65_21215 [Bradyrhizobium canariense]|nr:hypothetical protein BST65_21215 [Bradyrhizobium canariense]OSI30925.1 hypothetical protein BST66_20625 [Bradyrhizobium canariense]OSI39829.1 hypothetical protein BSZ20_28175 [Bradyrhizobium canariense]OSI48119.1 hypothetical protein BST67_18655 [Bradyrhizobium canariense]